MLKMNNRRLIVVIKVQNERIAEMKLLPVTQNPIEEHKSSFVLLLPISILCFLFFADYNIPGKG